MLCFCFLPTKAQNSITTYELKPTPTWVKKYPAPKPNTEETYPGMPPILQIESQYNHEIGEGYNRIFFYIVDEVSLYSLNSHYIEYEPDYETVSIHEVTIHRNNKKISYGDQLHVEYEQKGKQINGEHYDIDGKVIIFFDNKFKIGDVVELAYSSKGFQPDLHGTLFYELALTRNALTGKYYLRILSKKNKPLQYKLLNTTQEPSIRNRNGIMTLEYAYDSEDDSNLTSSPSFLSLRTQIHVTDLNSWDDYLALNQRNFLLNRAASPEIIQKVNTLVDTNAPKETQINSILNFLQKDIKYLEYDKIRPKQPEVVLKQGFGDCKSKSLLAVKMLETIGVESWPVIVNSLGYDSRLTDFSGHSFDHCVLEFVHETDTILFDATRNLQLGSIHDKYHSDFRYGFRVKEGTDQLNTITQNYKNNTTVETILHTREKNGFFRHFETTKVTYEGEQANIYAAIARKNGTSRFTDHVNDLLFERLWINDTLVKFTHQEKEPIAFIDISEHETKREFFEMDFESDTNNFTPKYLFNLLAFSETKSKSPKMTLPKFNKTTQTYKFVHPEAYKVAEDSVHYEKDWIKFSKKLTHQNDTLVAVYTTEILQKEINSDQFEEVRTDIETIKKLSGIVIDDPKSIIHTRENKIKYYITSYVAPVVLLIIAVLTILLIIKFVKRGRKIKRQRTEISELKAELKNHKTN
jgi:hypothetical protein